MRSSGQEVTHQDPCSRGQGRSKHPEEKHETGVLAQGKEGKNEANATAIYFFFWGGLEGGQDGTGIATLHRRARGASRTISTMQSIPKFCFTPMGGKDPLCSKCMEKGH